MASIFPLFSLEVLTDWVSIVRPSQSLLKNTVIEATTAPSSLWKESNLYVFDDLLYRPQESSYNDNVLTYAKPRTIAPRLGLLPNMRQKMNNICFLLSMSFFAKGQQIFQTKTSNYHPKRRRESHVHFTLVIAIFLSCCNSIFGQKRYHIWLLLCADEDHSHAHKRNSDKSLREPNTFLLAGNARTTDIIGHLIKAP